MKQTDVFDRLDNVIGNYMDRRVHISDVLVIVNEVNEYLKKHPHPHDIVNEND